MSLLFLGLTHPVTYVSETVGQAFTSTKNTVGHALTSTKNTFGRGIRNITSGTTQIANTTSTFARTTYDATTTMISETTKPVRKRHIRPIKTNNWLIALAVVISTVAFAILAVNLLGSEFFAFAAIGAAVFVFKAIGYLKGVGDNHYNSKAANLIMICYDDLLDNDNSDNIITTLNNVTEKNHYSHLTTEIDKLKHNLASTISQYHAPSTTDARKPAIKKQILSELKVFIARLDPVKAKALRVPA